MSEILQDFFTENVFPRPPLNIVLFRSCLYNNRNKINVYEFLAFFFWIIALLKINIYDRVLRLGESDESERIRGAEDSTKNNETLRLCSGWQTERAKGQKSRSSKSKKSNRAEVEFKIQSKRQRTQNFIIYAEDDIYVDNNCKQQPCLFTICPWQWACSLHHKRTCFNISQ